MKSKALKIVICGPESTGKTELANHLATVFGAELIPEYARTYIENLDRPYTYGDVEHIAGVQAMELEKAERRKSRVIILDTYLVITKVWFLEVYGRMPGWIDRQLEKSGIDLFLLCYYDMEWVADPVRENPGPRRIHLYERYHQEIESLGIPCETVRGFGRERFECAMEKVCRHFPQLKIR